MVRPFGETIRFPGTIPKEAFHSLMMKAWNTQSEIHGAQESLLIMEGGAMRGLFTAGVLDARGCATWRIRGGEVFG